MKSPISKDGKKLGMPGKTAIAAFLLAVSIVSCPRAVSALEPSPVTLLREIREARQLLELRQWIGAFRARHGRWPVSFQNLLRKPRNPQGGVAWLWLAHRNVATDFRVVQDFGSESWNVSVFPLLPDSDLILRISSEWEGVRVQSAGEKDSRPKPLDLRKLEARLEKLLEGSRDLDALLDGLRVWEAQRVRYLRKKGYACLLKELAGEKAAGFPLLPEGLERGRDYFRYTLSGVPGSEGCHAWAFQMLSDKPAFPSYEISSDGRVWVIPTWGPKKHLRLPLGEWPRRP